MMFRKYDKISNKLLLLFLLVAYFAAAYTIMYYFDIGCVFLELFSVPCPGCGMTRAFESLLKLDFYNAVKCNVVIFFMPYVFMYVFFDFKHKIHKFLMCLIAVIAIINWTIKLVLFI